MTHRPGMRIGVWGLGFTAMLLVPGLQGRALAQGGTWSVKEAMPTPRRNAGAGTIDGKIYVAGGLGDCHGISVLEIYDPASNTWTTGAPLPVAGKVDGSAVIAGRLHVLMTQASCTGPLFFHHFAYNPATDTWSARAPHPSFRQNYAAGVIDGKLYLAGGNPPGSASFLGTLEVYDPASDAWAARPSMLTPRQTVAGAVAGGKFYVLGGLQGCCASLATVEAYDPATNTWQARAPLPAARNQTAAGLLGGRIYVVGGLDEGVPFPALATTSFAYDPATNTWSAAAAIPTPRAGHAAAVAGSALHVFGGNVAVPPGTAPSHLALAAGEAPVANAGPDQSIHAGQTVVLDGSGSFDDNTATSALIFAWTLVIRPDGSSAGLTGSSTMTPTFVADLPGSYEVSLTVTDADGLSSAPDTVLISSLNAGPTADAGPDQGAVVGSPVTLDGSGSSDPDGDLLIFSWVLAAPAGSSTTLSGAASAFPSFTPDVPGIYTATLTVDDGLGGVAADTVDVSVITAEQFAENQTQTALNAVGGLPPSSVTTQGNRQALQNFLTQAIAALQAGDLAEARTKLADALRRTDGCVVRGAPDGNGPGRDWVTDCTVQMELYRQLQAALDALAP